MKWATNHWRFQCSKDHQIGRAHTSAVTCPVTWCTTCPVTWSRSQYKSCAFPTTSSGCNPRACATPPPLPFPNPHWSSNRGHTERRGRSRLLTLSSCRCSADPTRAATLAARAPDRIFRRAPPPGRHSICAARCARRHLLVLIEQFCRMVPTSTYFGLECQPPSAAPLAATCPITLERPLVPLRRVHCGTAAVWWV